MTFFKADKQHAVIELKNEFARVRISKEETANGPRLMIVDVRNGKVGFLDPLELENLAWVKHSELAALVDPSRIAAESTNGPVDDDDIGV